LLCDLVGLDSKLETNDKIINKYTYKRKKDLYSEYEYDCIKVLDDNSLIESWKLCSHCGRYFPNHKNFFTADKRINDGLSSNCRVCANGNFTYNQGELHNIYIRFKEQGFYAYKNHETLKIYELFINSNEEQIPKIIFNKWDYETILKELHINNKIDKQQLSYDYLINTFKLHKINKLFKSIEEIFTLLYGDYEIYHPWKCNSLKVTRRNFTRKDFNYCKIVFDNYLKENKIKIINPLEFNYSYYAKECRILKHTNDVLEFAVKYNEYKYAGYKFKTKPTNYYKKEENRLFDMKYLIEQDMKIDINKIPLYITKMTLQRNARSLYHVLHKGGYYANLFEWIDKIYPNKFIEADFVINPYRNEFDSIEEATIHDILVAKFKNVIYNQRNTDRTININGMIPDWFIFTDKGVYIVEYFGLFANRDIENSRLNDYEEKMLDKLEKYSKLEGYTFVGLYPSDLKNNFETLHKKLEMIN
jgi:hypothetical protein